MTAHRKPTRTDDNKPSRSTPFRNGSMSKEQIEQEALKLTKVPEIIQEVQAPAIKCERKPIYTPGNYKVYAATLQAMIDEHNTVTVSRKSLSEIFPQTKHTRNISENLKRTYGLNYRYSDANGGEYVFFDGETKDEIIERLEWVEENNNRLIRDLKLYINNIKQEKHELESELINTEDQRNQSLLLAIILFIYILISNYYG